MTTTDTSNPTMTKAQIKRLEQARKALVNQLNIQMVDFKERFLSSYVKWKFAELESQLKQEIKAQSEWTDAETIKWNWKPNFPENIARLEKKISQTYSRTLEFITEASENYNLKFDRLVEAMIKAGIENDKFTVQKIKDATEFDFSFLVSFGQLQVFARIIFACGEINAPHYRFIITKNNKNLHY